MKTFFKTISKYKISSILNILGLAAAFSALYIILVQVHYDLTFNKNIKDSERICVVFAPGWTGIDSYQANMSRPMANRLFKDCPLIEYYAVGDVGWQSDGCVERDGEIKEMSIKTAKINNTFLNVLGVEIIAGNIEDLEKPNSCAISESFAKKYNLEIDGIFYNSIKPDPNSISIVKLIYKDIVGNNDFSNIELFYDMDNENLEDWSNWNYTYFIKYKKGANISGLMNHIHNEGKKLLEERGTKNEEIEEELNKFKFKLVPLRESIFNEDRSNLRRSNRTTVYTLLSLAILVVIIALINFINFFFALVPLRIKNVNTKKVFGSSNLKLRLSFITEALGIIFISLIISYITVQLLKNSYLADCISCSIEFNNNTFSIIVTLLSGILIALIGSIYPSIYITSFPTAMVIKGGFASSKSGRILRNILISLQFIISITLISSSLFIKTQYNYMVNYNLGFNKTDVYSVYVPQNLVRTLESRNILSDKLLENTDITGVSYMTGNLVANGRMGWGRDFKGETISLQVTPVTWDFLEFMGIKIEEGRNFLPEDELKPNGIVIINRKAANEYNMEVGDKFTGHSGEGNAEIVGISSNFNYMTLSFDIKPFIFYIYGTRPWSFQNNLHFRIKQGADIKTTIDYVKKTVNNLYPDYPIDKLEVKYFDQQLITQYSNVDKISYLISFFTILSVLISLMGVFGLVMFETQYRKKEIGLRRVNGASIIQILNMFNYKYLKILLICFIISIPISYIFITNWLKSFAFHIPIYWWIFALSLLIIIIITLTIVTLRSLSAACDNPINSLKNNE